MFRFLIKLQVERATLVLSILGVSAVAGAGGFEDVGSISFGHGNEDANDFGIELRSATFHEAETASL